MPWRRLTILLLTVCLATQARLGRADPVAAGASNDSPLAKFEAALPRGPQEFTTAKTEALRHAASRVVDWVAGLSDYRNLEGRDALVQRVDSLTANKARVDELLGETLARRGSFAALPAGPSRRELLRNYLRTTSTLIDLSGQLRYLLFDAVFDAAERLAEDPAGRDALVDVMARYKSSIGAAVMIEDLFDPLPDSGAKPVSFATKVKLLHLLVITGLVDELPTVVEFARDQSTPPKLVLAAAATIRRLGLPQDPHPRQLPNLPQPAITARQLAELLGRIDPAQLDATFRRRREDLLAWLDSRARRGINEDHYRLGRFKLRPGDWLLMRNPSPYNLFTDLAPGLFTHVGVLTTDEDSDGRRRMVLIDLPERGTHMQTTNIEVFVKRTLHYVVLRHADPEVGRTMARVAHSMIGNPTQFDLNFRTERVADLRGKPLAGQKIHTYCAGLLLLCAQETRAPRSDFFPIPEYPAGGKNVSNLAKLGITFGEDFVSPTGALFAPRLQIVGRRDSMYDPRREIEEAIYDHFAIRLVERELSPAPDLFQSIRVKLAEAARTNPLLAQALAKAANVDENLDLLSAAKTAAVVETLDEVARGNSRAFRHARQALTAGPANTLGEAGFKAEEIAAIKAYRERHAELYERLRAERLSPRRLRMELVKYYIQKGNRQLDARFFEKQSSGAEPQE